MIKKEYLKQWKKDHPERVREIARKGSKKYYYKNRERLLQKGREYQKANKQKFYKYVEEYRKRNPEKHRAHRKVQAAVRSGKLIKSAFCDNAGCMNETNLQSHHYLGYKEENWFDVMFLCRKHHIQAHK